MWEDTPESPGEMSHHHGTSLGSLTKDFGRKDKPQAKGDALHSGRKCREAPQMQAASLTRWPLGLGEASAWRQWSLCQS